MKEEMKEEMPVGENGSFKSNNKVIVTIIYVVHSSTGKAGGVDAEGSCAFLVMELSGITELVGTVSLLW